MIFFFTLILAVKSDLAPTTGFETQILEPGRKTAGKYSEGII